MFCVYGLYEILCQHLALQMAAYLFNNDKKILTPEKCQSKVPIFYGACVSVRSLCFKYLSE